MLKMSAVGGKAAVVIVMIVAAFLSGCGKKVIVGSKDEVRYEGTATKEEAEDLGKALKDSGYVQDRGVSVIVSKVREGTIIALVVKDGFSRDHTTLGHIAY